jgi:hypothetical protein
VAAHAVIIRPGRPKSRVSPRAALAGRRQLHQRYLEHRNDANMPPLSAMTEVGAVFTGYRTSPNPQPTSNLQTPPGGLRISRIKRHRRRGNLHAPSAMNLGTASLICRPQAPPMKPSSGRHPDRGDSTTAMSEAAAESDGPTMSSEQPREEDLTPSCIALPNSHAMAAGR